ncbi:ankyrin repeat domain-containing protein [Azospirillum sp. YIM B02556]|uniref:Ankyrin repeat domain-containing protein n=1 Tax=Azospirillum endophyticum TaxID=2800326 RepID=A0ABS1FBZ9_9PROT|nr:ankyrin repeat domain-containing protein [Azospirillum endophyticum]MBK1840939.1 ankyrin repeat domain-containing protein [Azospirillum endophyticum]
MDRSAPKHSSRARRAAPGHHDPSCESVGTTAAEVRDGLVLAFLARKRLLVLVGDAGSGRPALFRQLVEHVEADGAMALPVMASVGAEVEDLVAAAGTGALPDLAAGGEDGEADFDALIAALEERLELAGSGLLAVDNAAVLAPPVLADLVDLTRAETPAGRFMQVLLCGTPELEGTLARAGLADELRDMGVVYRLPAGGGMADDARAAAPVSRAPSPRPAPILAVPPPPVVEEEPARMERRGPQQAPPPPAAIPPANDWSAGQRQDDLGWSDRAPAPVAGPMTGAERLDAAYRNGGYQDGHQGGYQEFGQAQAMRAPRRTGLYAGAALTTLVLLGAAGAAIFTAVPGASPDRALAMIEDGWARARDSVERTVQELIGGNAPAAKQQAAAPAAGAPVSGSAASPAVPAVTQPAATVPASRPAVTTEAQAAPGQGSQSVASPPATGTQTVAKSGASLASASTTPTASAPVETAALPPVQSQPPASVPAAAKPPASAGSTEAAPGVASLPPLEDPSATAAVPTVPQAAAADAETAQRVRAMVDQARRQIAGKRLTTPPGDNAYETVQRIRQIAPATPEAAELLTTMADTYRRWALLAERDGDWSETKRFYERAQMIAPDSPDLAERIRAASEQRVYTGPAIGSSTGTAPGSSTVPAKATPGLGDRESVLALLRNPAELSRTLQGGATADSRLDNGKTLLMIAAEQGLTDAVRVLLERHARTDLRTSDGATAVMYAAWGGHDAVVRALADGGADLDTTNSDGKTALMAAAARGHEDVARTLIQRGVMVDRTTAYGWSALMYAANNGHETVAKLLLDNGANPYRMDANGNSALTLGALQGHVQVVEALKPR